MALVNRPVDRRDTVVNDNDGVVESDRPVQTVTTRSPQNTLTNLVWFIFGFIAIVLAMRFVLLLAGANSSNGFVSFIYSLSKVFSAPFDSIFGSTTVTTGQMQSVFEPSVLVAIAVYALVAWGISKLININRRPSTVA